MELPELPPRIETFDQIRGPVFSQYAMQAYARTALAAAEERHLDDLRVLREALEKRDAEIERLRGEIGKAQRHLSTLRDPNIGNP